MEPRPAPAEIDIAKMAVVIDCEGHIAINGSRKRRYYALHVTVGNTAFVLLEWCHAKFAGKIYENFYKKKRGPEYAPAKRWRVQSFEAKDLLALCLDHFIIKKEQAEIAIEFQRTFTIPGARITLQDIDIRQALKERLQALTRRGPKRTKIDGGSKAEEPKQRNLFAKDFSN
jgi:hypothetical protein